MFNALKRLYDTGRLPKLNLRNAIPLGWITADEYKIITGEEYVA